MENALVSEGLQENQRRDTFPRGRVQAWLVFLQIGKSVERNLDIDAFPYCIVKY